MIVCKGLNTLKRSLPKLCDPRLAASSWGFPPTWEQHSAHSTPSAMGLGQSLLFPMWPHVLIWSRGQKRLLELWSCLQSTCVRHTSRVDSLDCCKNREERGQGTAHSEEFSPRKAPGAHYPLQLLPQPLPSVLCLQSLKGANERSQKHQTAAIATLTNISLGRVQD